MIPSTFHLRDAVFAAVATLVMPACASAELGGPLSSVAVDRGRMAAQVRSVAMGHYIRHELTRANGGAVRELTNGKGEVFAVTWSGPGKPDLKTLLGRYFARMQASGATRNGTAGRAMHSLRHPPLVNEPDLQIQASGHMGWFRGAAFVPSLAPAGFAASELAEQP